MCKPVISATLLVAAVYSVASEAAWNLGPSVEYYNWQEKATDATGATETLTERGPRFALDLSWEEEHAQGLAWGYHGQGYVGQVVYDTFIQQPGSPNDGKPITTISQYLGMINEARLSYRSNFGSYRMDYGSGLGSDMWRRTIGYSQIEDYSILFVRVGISLDQPGRGPGLHGGAGVKYPFWTREDAHLTDQGYNSNPVITPGKNTSLYAELSYRVNPQLDLIGYFDSWRFSASNVVTSIYYPDNKAYHIYQPQSSMNAVGARIMFSF